MQSGGLGLLMSEKMMPTRVDMKVRIHGVDIL